MFLIACYHLLWSLEQLAKALERQAPKAFFQFAFFVSIQRQEEHKSSAIATEGKFYLKKKAAHGWHYIKTQRSPMKCEEWRISKRLPIL